MDPPGNLSGHSGSSQAQIRVWPDRIILFTRWDRTESMLKPKSFSNYSHNGYMFNLSPGEYEIEVQSLLRKVSTRHLSCQGGMGWMIRTVGDDVILYEWNKNSKFIRYKLKLLCFNRPYNIRLILSKQNHKLKRCVSLLKIVCKSSKLRSINRDPITTTPTLI